MLLREMDFPSWLIVASGSSPAMVLTVLEKPLPPWVLKGMMVLPLKSFCSKKLGLV